jgi:hypothetical protein
MFAPSTHDTRRTDPTPEDEVIGTPSAQDNSPSGSRVTVVLPDAREHVWSSGRSAVASWTVGQVVAFRNREWRVVGHRRDESDTLTVTLAPLSAATDASDER